MANEIKKTTKKTRIDRNNELIHRMRAGEVLTSFDSKSSWYPPRPIIEKDVHEIARLYGNGVIDGSTAKKQSLVEVELVDMESINEPAKPFIRLIK
jgi:hypothetical protein